jgi:hypothetical protein
MVPPVDSALGNLGFIFQHFYEGTHPEFRALVLCFKFVRNVLQPRTMVCHYYALSIVMPNMGLFLAEVFQKEGITFKLRIAHKFFEINLCNFFLYPWLCVETAAKRSTFFCKIKLLPLVFRLFELIIKLNALYQL